MKKILVPTDFSQQAEWATEVAIGIAQKSAGRIVLLHVVEQPTRESFNVEGQITGLDLDMENKLFTLKMIERGKAKLAQICERIQALNLDVAVELRMGNPYHGIRTVIASHDVDLVVMGTTSRSRAEELIVGSNTNKVVRYSKCPVLTVHQKPASVEFKSIVYATSMSEEEAAFADVVTNAQLTYDATVHIVRINTPMNFRPDTESLRALEKFAKKSKLKKYTLNVFNDFSEEEGIIHFASRVGANLIAMATHGRTGFSHVLIGSIAEDVVSHSTRPVLTYVTK